MSQTRPPSRRELSARLTALAHDMVEAGVELAYYGGLHPLAIHGQDLVDAANQVARWAAELAPAPTHPEQEPPHE